MAPPNGASFNNRRLFSTRGVVDVSAPADLANPYINKYTGFTPAERAEAGIEGLIPPAVETIDEQADRCWHILENLEKPINKYQYLMMVQTTNVRLFYKVLARHLTALLPVIYTPTVGEACQRYSEFSWGHTQGLFLDITMRGRLAQVLDNWHDEPDIMVVTDGGRILGLGDLGAGGMGIPVGKLNLYVAGGGFDPRRCLPVVLDVGCDSDAARSRWYVGLRRPRVHGDEHTAFVDEFMAAAAAKWPRAIIQFEDFQTEYALKYLSRYRPTYRHFNDDVQGTAAVVVAGFLNGLKVQGTDLADARVVMYGAGSSSLGVSTYIVEAMVLAGVDRDKASRAIYMVDRKGLITATRGDTLNEYKAPFARRDGTPDMAPLAEIIAHVRPHALFGLSGAGPTFTRADVEALCAGCDRPLLFPLSNPTTKAEISLEDAVAWSGGKALFAAGSPFGPVEYQGRTFTSSQCNNMLIFPGLGQGTHVAMASTVTDAMVLAGSFVVADYVSDAERDAGQLYPDLAHLRDIGKVIAGAVWRAAAKDGVATVQPPESDEALRAAVEDNFFDAESYYYGRHFGRKGAHCATCPE